MRMAQSRSHLAWLRNLSQQYRHMDHLDGVLEGLAVLLRDAVLYSAGQSVADGVE
jgi:hypothetical protein